MSRISDEQIGLIVQFRMTGASCGKIGRAAGMSRVTVRKIVEHLEQVGHYREFTLAEPFPKQKKLGDVTNRALEIIAASQDGLILTEIVASLAAHGIKTTKPSLFQMLKKQCANGLIKKEHRRYLAAE